MDTKAILKNPAQKILEHWASFDACPYSNDIMKTVDQINTIKKKIKSLRNEKQNLSRSFSQAELNPQDLTKLKLEISQLSTELKVTEANYKKLFNSLAKFFSSSEPSPKLPARFVVTSAEKINDPTTTLNYTIVEVHDDFSTKWDEYVNNHLIASPYHRYQWRQVIESSFKHSCRYFAAMTDSGECCGVLPTTQMVSTIFGRYLVSLPYFNYGGPLAANQDVTQALLDHAATVADQNRLSFFEVRSIRSLNEWRKRTDKASMVLSLPDTADAFSKHIGTKIRAQINAARKHLLTTKHGHNELLDGFYQVFAENMRDLGTPVYSQSFFKCIIDSQPSPSTIFVVYHNGRPVSAAFLVGQGDTLEIPWASTLRQANRLNANMFLYWNVLKFAIENDYRYFDFGRSSKDSNTYRFKKQWGAQPVQHYWHYWLPAGETLPALNPDNPKYKLAIKVWQKLPVWLTRLLGPPIAKNLP